MTLRSAKDLSGAVIHTPMMPTYAVRRPGFTAWAFCASREEAEKEQELANRVCCPGHRIYMIDHERLGR